MIGESESIPRDPDIKIPDFLQLLRQLLGQLQVLLYFVERFLRNQWPKFFKVLLNVFRLRFTRSFSDSISQHLAKLKFLLSRIDQVTEGVALHVFYFHISPHECAAAPARCAR